VNQEKTLKKTSIHVFLKRRDAFHWYNIRTGGMGRDVWRRRRKKRKKVNF
jgi:hypothetical protein